MVIHRTVPVVLGVIAAAMTLSHSGGSESLTRLGDNGRPEWTFTTAVNDHSSISSGVLYQARRPEADFFDDPPCQQQMSGPLPDRFDWSDTGKVTPATVGQGACGSCWAFAINGAVESQLLINGATKAPNLSEQWLVSCIYDSCNGWVAYTAAMAYMAGGTTDKCGGYGGIPESEFPYGSFGGHPTACACPYSNATSPGVLITNRTRIGTSGDPSMEEIKTYLFANGPVIAGMYSTDAVTNYQSGIINECTGAPSETGMNHYVLITGWDDTLGAAGAWRFKNSLGYPWGDQGFGWIEYDCLNIGVWATGVLITPSAGQNPMCPGDADGDLDVDINDLLTAIAGWHVCPPCFEDCDPYTDGLFNIHDLLEIVQYWGTCDAG